MVNFFYKLYVFTMTVLTGIVVVGFASRMMGNGSIFGVSGYHQSYLKAEDALKSNFANASSTVSTEEIHAQTAGIPASRYRLQFTNCKGFANTTKSDTMLIKKGEQMALENLDAGTRTIFFQGKHYSIAPLDYVLVTARGGGEYPALCNGKKSAVVNVQP